MTTGTSLRTLRAFTSWKVTPAKPGGVTLRIRPGSRVSPGSALCILGVQLLLVPTHMLIRTHVRHVHKAPRVLQPVSIKRWLSSATRPPSGSAAWSPVRRSLTWATPSARSRSPRTTAYVAPTAVGRLHRPLEPPAADGQVGRDSGPPQFGDHGEQSTCSDRPQWDREHLHRRDRRHRQALGLHGQQRPLDPERPPHTGQPGPPISSARPSYRPPPPTADCAPSLSCTNSYRVRV